MLRYLVRSLHNAYLLSGAIRRGMWLLCLCSVLACASAWADVTAPTLEQQVKAAYLYRFVDHIEWPDGALSGTQNALTIGVVGDAGVVTALNTLVQARGSSAPAITVRAFKPGDAISGVQILFIGTLDNHHVKNIVASLDARPVLIVTEEEGGLDLGSMINFVPVDNRIRFEVSLPHATHNGLKISARLLAVAQRVEREGAAK